MCELCECVEMQNSSRVSSHTTVVDRIAYLVKNREIGVFLQAKAMKYTLSFRHYGRNMFKQDDKEIKERGVFHGVCWLNSFMPKELYEFSSNAVVERLKLGLWLRDEQSSDFMLLISTSSCWEVLSQSLLGLEEGLGFSPTKLGSEKPLGPKSIQLSCIRKWPVIGFQGTEDAGVISFPSSIQDPVWDIEGSGLDSALMDPILARSLLFWSRRRSISDRYRSSCTIVRLTVKAKSWI